MFVFSGHVVDFLVDSRPRPAPGETHQQPTQPRAGRRPDRSTQASTEPRKDDAMTLRQLQINGTAQTVDVEDDMPLLWVLRDALDKTGTKFGCGIGLCGACTVHVDGVATRSCSVRVADVSGRQVTTIEGLSADRSHPVQQAWIAEQVPQCGYCQSGMVMAVAALLAKTPKPTDVQIDESIGNICRCGTYGRVRSAIHRAVRLSAAA
jgi:aerobic-type carbon monoxide dehydrogenase small subunit (CoxS/CutS family)